MTIFKRSAGLITVITGTPTKLVRSLQGNDEIQCITGNSVLPFGKAQSPGLSDYADGVDTMQFYSLGLIGSEPVIKHRKRCLSFTCQIYESLPNYMLK